MLRHVLAAAVVAMGVTASARAANITVQVDPEGTGGASPLTREVQSFDWSVGNALAVGGNTAVQTWAATQNAPGGPVQVPFDLYYQAQLASLVLPGDTPFVPANLINAGGNAEITIVAGFTEVVTSVTGIPGQAGSIATFDLASNPRVNFLEFYFDSSADASSLQGTGFNNTTGVAGTIDPDARLILRAEITDIIASNFQLNPGTGNLDQVGTDNYPLIDTVLGAGATNLQAKVTFADSDFFVDVQDLINANILLTLFNSSQVLPFAQVNPSARFLESAVNTAENIPPILAGAGEGIPSLGTVNGGAIILPNGQPGPGGPDIQLQVDGNSSFAVVPEPASMTLLLCGAAGLGLTGIRRRRNKDAEIA